MRDVLPEEARQWRYVENRLLRILLGYAYEEIQLPLLEATELFSRGVGEATDIVEKEMYNLADRDGESLTLRPEGTAGCVRVLQQHGLLFNQTQRVFYTGPMFRYERPQKGRYRQFYQIGAEAFGFAGPDVDVELILLGRDFWQALGVEERVELEINTLGSGTARAEYREALVAYLTPLKNELDEASHPAVLARTTGLLLVCVIEVGPSGNRFAVRNLRRTGCYFAIVFALHPFDVDFEVQLTHTGNHRLVALGVYARTESWIFANEATQGLAHIVGGLLIDRLDRHGDHGVGNVHRSHRHLNRQVGKGIAGRAVNAK